MSHQTKQVFSLDSADALPLQTLDATKDLGIESYFITISHDPSFLEIVKKNIDKEKQLLVMCAAGGRSIIAANLLAKEGYRTLNISDGFSGNGQDPGWKNLGLPSIINN